MAPDLEPNGVAERRARHRQDDHPDEAHVVLRCEHAAVDDRRLAGNDKADEERRLAEHERSDEEIGGTPARARRGADG